jgi:hypothetical protein
LVQATISNDGAQLMKLLDIVHPAAKTLVDISLSQDAEVGSTWLLFLLFISPSLLLLFPSPPLSLSLFCCYFVLLLCLYSSAELLPSPCAASIH